MKLCIEIEEWMYEDTMTEEDMYNALFSLSKVSFVRMFPKKIRTIVVMGQEIIKGGKDE